MRGYEQLPICPRCIEREISGWLNENQQQLDKDTMIGTRQELRSIGLEKGECIVCGEEKVARNTIERILKLLNENEAEEELKRDFLKSFYYQR